MTAQLNQQLAVLRSMPLDIDPAAPVAIHAAYSLRLFMAVKSFLLVFERFGGESEEYLAAVRALRDLVSVENPELDKL